MANMELEGIGDLIEKIEEMGKQGVKAENRALKKAGQIILEEARINTPKKTGKLKKGLKLSGIREKGTSKYVLVGIQKGDNSSIFYGKFLEFGTSKMPAKPFMSPAYESKKKEAQEVIKLELKSALNLK
nr:HK97-gp10 family putative phage morphogenesis protein [Clostridium ihumii]